jgi:hypothetical protein
MRAAALLRLLGLLLALALACSASPPAADASTEEFSTFYVEHMEEDDESLIDHLLTEPPVEWRDEWERSAGGYRASQGCFTSGQWFLANQLKVAAPLGDRARFRVHLDHAESDRNAYQNLDLWFLFPQRVGTVGFMFRPFHDKSRQDVALMWEAGADSTASQLRLLFGLEDLFNNLWAWRQTRVGDVGEPYERHPWEPAIKVALRRARWRFETEGKWLTPSRKRVEGNGGLTGERLQTLWGARGTALLEARALGLTWVARAENQQVRSTDRPVDLSAGDGREFRRLWRAEAGVRCAIVPRLKVEGRYVYVERTQSSRPPLPDLSFRGLDRIVQVEARWMARPDLTVRLGGLFDRIGIHRSAPSPYWPHGTRTESRAYVGVVARFGRVTVAGVEGIELDPENYEVWNAHDKGFLLLQTTF